MAKTTRKKKAADKKSIQVPSIDIGRARFTIMGTSPLLCDQFTAVKKRQITDSQTGVARGGLAPRDPDAEYESSKYKMRLGKREVDAFPSAGIKGAMVESAPYCQGLDKKLVRGAVHMCQEFFHLKHEDVCRHDSFGRNAGRSGGRIPRFRSEYHGWKIDVEFEHDKDAITVEQIAGLLKVAGFRIGIGNWTPQKNGFHGKFTVK